MKRCPMVGIPWTTTSPPAWGARIETCVSGWLPWGVSGRPPRGGRGLKLIGNATVQAAAASPPAWGARIETVCHNPTATHYRVAPRVGGAD